jgi:hypothetical protein
MPIVDAALAPEEVAEAYLLTLLDICSPTLSANELKPIKYSLNIHSYIVI